MMLFSKKYKAVFSFIFNAAATLLIIYGPDAFRLNALRYLLLWSQMFCRFAYETQKSNTLCFKCLNFQMILQGRARTQDILLYL